MNLPNYFIADLPPEATLTAAIISDACQTLKMNREKYLARRTTRELVEFLSVVGESWLQPHNAFRRLALDGAAATGFSRATLAAGLDAFFRRLTPDQFEALLVQDLGHGKRLDDLVSTVGEE